MNFVELEHGAEQIWEPLFTNPLPESTKRVRLISPTPSAGLLTFAVKVQFVPHPSVAPEVTPLTVSYSRFGVPSATVTSSTVKTHLFSESKHSFVVVPRLAGYPASVLYPWLSVVLNLNSLFPISPESKVA